METETPKHGFRTFLILWTTQSMSVLGSMLTYFGIIIWLSTDLYPAEHQKAQLAFAISGITIARTLFTLIITPFAGIWVDRYDRKKMMIIANMGSCILNLTLGILLVLKISNLWWILLFISLYSVFSNIHGAAFDTIYVGLVPKSRLARTHGMMQTTWSLAGIISPGIAATIIALPRLLEQGRLPFLDSILSERFQDGMVLITGIDTLTFFMSAIVLFFLPIPSIIGKKKQKPKTMWGDIREGIIYLRQQTGLLWLLSIFAVINFVAPARQIFYPLLIKFNLAEDWARNNYSFETALALLSTVSSIGGVAGGLLISTWGGFKRRRIFGIIIPAMISAVMQLTLGLSSSYYLSIATVFTLSMMVPLVNAHSQAIWQSRTPPELQGRVFAVRRLLAQCTNPLGALFAGIVGGIFNPGIIMASLGTILLLFCGVQLFNSKLIHVDDPVPDQELPEQTLHQSHA